MDHEDGGGATNGMGIDSRSEMSGSEAPSRHNSPTRHRSTSRAPSVTSASAFSAHTTDVEIASTVDHNHHHRHPYRGRARRAGSVETVMQSEDNGQNHSRNRSLLSTSGANRNTLWNRSMNQLLNSNREEGKEGVLFLLLLSISYPYLISSHSSLDYTSFYRISTTFSNR